MHHLPHKQGVYTRKHPYKGNVATDVDPSTFQTKNKPMEIQPGYT